ncbi:MAG TPA: flagellar FlbD family protein [Spirochaetales bacterium]|nr:flagellar FlbD family protein [Spirochaetales bacterium]
MIQLTQLGGKNFWINPHLIEYIETTPDTTLTLTSGKHVIVREKVDAVIDAIIAYRRKLGLFGNEE